MKTLTIFFAALFCFASPLLAGPKWSHQAIEGEDATSAHYYFYASDGDSIQRVRWVWNGGAQNPPTVTEYLLGPEKITVRHLVGKRESVAALIAGRDADWKLEQEYSLSSASSAKMLVPASPKKSLTDLQRNDLKNLIDLLAKERKPYKTKVRTRD